MPTVAIIGTRQPSQEQAAAAELLARTLSADGVYITTGGADGIDRLAMQGTLPGFLKVFVPWAGFHTELIPSHANRVIAERVEHARWFDAVKKYHPAPAKLSRGDMALLARNCGIIEGADLVVSFSNERGTGGTGFGIKLAAVLEIPILNCKKGKPVPSADDLLRQCQSMIMMRATQSCLWPGPAPSWLTHEDAAPSKEKNMQSVSKKSDSVRFMTLGHKFTGRSAVGPLLEKISSICKSGPEYITPSDIDRHLYFIEQLSRLRVPPFFIQQALDEYGPRSAFARAVKVNRLLELLDYWVLGCFDSGSDLMPHYALDTALLIRRLAFGFSDYSPRSWKIDGLVKGCPPDNLHEPAKGFKVHFSTRTNQRNSEVLAVVPDSVQVTCADLYGKRLTRLSAGTRFSASLIRCHLSQSVTENSFLKIEEPARTEREFNVCSDFKLVGYIGSVPGITSPELEANTWSKYYSLINLPAEWVTHEVVTSNDGQVTLVSLPNWSKKPPQAQ